MDDKKTTGIFIKGTVIGRTRKSKMGKNMVELITYKVDTEIGALFVKDWAPEEYIELGTIIDEPVRVGVYNGKYDLTFLNLNTQGEEF